MFNNNYNPYYMPQQRYQQMMPNQIQEPSVPYVQSNNKMLLGKTVESIDVVKAMDIPLDGSINYFPLIDGSAIITKQLQNDGTSKILVYRPVEETEKEMPKYASIDDVKKEIDKIDLSELDDIRDEIKEIKRQLKAKKNGND